MPVTTDRIRTVALVGHQGAGKTTLAEALLHLAGVVPRRGRVEDGTTVCDTEPEEQARGFSLSLAFAPFDWQGHRINLIDTPGYPDVAHEVRAAMAVADLVVFVVSAVDGVEVQTERYWREAAERGLPRMVFVNKLDRDRADFERTLGELQERLGGGFEPLELAIGAEAGFHGVADLLTESAFVYDHGTAEPAAIPEELAAHEHEVHDHLVEDIVMVDEELLEHYLEGEEPSPTELEHTLARTVAAGTAYPVLCGSATTGVAVDRLATFICELAPAPAVDPAGPTSLFVFRTVADAFVGRVNVFKVLSGTLSADDHLVNRRSGKDERLHSLVTFRGRDQVPVDRVVAGDIAAVAKLADTATGDLLSPAGAAVDALDLPVLAPPAPVFAVGVRPRTQADDDKLATGLHRLVEEDPALSVVRHDETHQTLLAGQGETHVQVALEKLARRYGVAVETEPVRVAYRETVTGSAEAEGRYKKQTGGHGQFGVCVLRLSPLERGAGFEFVDRIVGGAIPRQFIPAVQKGVEETMAEGGVAGFPVVDVRVELLDGKFHAVDSSEASFKAAARLAFRAAMADAAPVVLEPISHLTVTVPSELQGDVMGDITARRGRVLGAEPAAGGYGEQAVRAEVPAAELVRYAVELRSLTAGRGSFAEAPSRYDVVPAHLVPAPAER